MTYRNAVIWSAALAAVLAVTHARADVTLEQRIEVKAGGALASMSSKGTTKTRISKDKSASESHMESRSGFMGSGGGDDAGTSIMRLDRGLMWQLQPNRRQYVEMTFDQMRAQMEQARAQLQRMQQGGGASALPVRAQDCQWSNAQGGTRATGERKRFANIKAKQYITTFQETCTVPSSGQVCTVAWTAENWMAKRMPGRREARAFGQAMADQLNMGGLSGAPGQSAALFGMYGFGEGWEDVFDEVGELDGYPVKSVMKLEMSGDNCTVASGQPIAMDEVWRNAMGAGVEAGARTAGYHAGQKVTHEATKAMGGGVAGDIAGSAVGSASGEVISGLLSHFGRKKTQPKPQEAPAAADSPGAAAGSGSAVLYYVSSEITAVDDKRIDPSVFEPPAGWKKVSGF